MYNEYIELYVHERTNHIANCLQIMTLTLVIRYFNATFFFYHLVIVMEYSKTVHHISIRSRPSAMTRTLIQYTRILICDLIDWNQMYALSSLSEKHMPWRNIFCYSYQTKAGTMSPFVWFRNSQPNLSEAYFSAANCFLHCYVAGWVIRKLHPAGHADHKLNSFVLRCCAQCIPYVHVWIY